MSDSDDTDILLLIPPNFFLTETSIDGDCSFNYGQFQSNLRDANILNMNPTSNGNQLGPNNMDSQNLYTNSFLMPATKSITDQFKYTKYSEASPSTSTSFSPYAQQEHITATSSTPYHVQNSLDFRPTMSTDAQKKDDGLVLEEIDQYLGKRSIQNTSGTSYRTLEPSASNYPTVIERNQEISPGRPMLNESVTPNQNKIQKYASKPSEDDILNSLVGTKMSEWNAGLQKSMHQDDQLISLANVWECDGHERLSRDSVALEEEQLRRRQCERTIQHLQTQLQQYQDKYSDAIKMDQTKNGAMARLHKTNSSLIVNITELENQLSALELKMHREKESLHAENKELKSRVQQLHQQNMALERKNNSLLLSTNEVREIHKKQLEDLEIRLSNSKENENILINEISKLKSQFTTQTTEYEKEKRRSNEIEKQLMTLQQTFSEQQRNEKNILQELESQRVALKLFYQTQLEEVVQAKLEEYQKQLDSVEEKIRKETRQNERAIAERAIKQIELINQKNEQEFLLLEEKQREEIELYKIRMFNATKTIAQLEENLSAYRTKRNDIAERLHNVIETQWQQTLEIITNTEQPMNSIDKQRLLNDINRNKMDLENFTENRLTRQIICAKVENEIFHTPNTSKLRKNLIKDLE